MTDRVARGQMITKITMQANSARGICPSMIIHKDPQLGQKIMEHVEGPMILGKESMPQYATCRGQPLDQKVNESLLKDLVLLEKECMPQYVTVNEQRYKMPQNYYALKYAHPLCDKNAQP